MKAQETKTDQDTNKHKKTIECSQPYVSWNVLQTRETKTNQDTSKAKKTLKCSKPYASWNASKQYAIWNILSSQN